MLCTKVISLQIKEMASLKLGCSADTSREDAVWVHFWYGQDRLFAHPQSNSKQKPLSYQGSIDEHIRLLQTSESVLKRLVEDSRIQNATLPTLTHTNLHKRNVYVQPHDRTTIAGIIDWQSTSIDPAFVYANETPDFASPSDRCQLEEDKSTDPGPEKKKKLNDAKICHKTYEVIMKSLIPKLRPAKLLDPILYDIPLLPYNIEG